MALIIVSIATASFIFWNKSKNPITTSFFLDPTTSNSFMPVSAEFENEQYEIVLFNTNYQNIGNLYVPIKGFNDQAKPTFQDLPIIFNLDRASSEYSDFWHLYYAVIPDDKKSLVLTSEDALKSNNIELINSGQIVDQALISDQVNAGLPQISGFANGKKVNSILISQDVPVAESKIVAGKIYVLGDDFNIDKQQLTVQNFQKIILSASPISSLFSPLMEIIYTDVPATFNIDLVKEESDILKNNLSTRNSNIFVNVLILDDQTFSSGSNSNTADNKGAEQQIEETNQNLNDTQNQNQSSEMNETTPDIQVAPNSENMSKTGDDRSQVLTFYQNYFGEKVVIILIKDNSFWPSSKIEIPVGNSVVWINEDQSSHIISSKNNSFSSQPINYYGGYKVDFVKKGIFEFCLDGMPVVAGQINVY